MLKNPFWLAVMGLLVAGGVLVYVQWQRSIAPPEFPADLTLKVTLGNTAQQLPASETAPPPVVTTSAAPTTVCPPATPPLEPESPHIFFPEQPTIADSAVGSVFRADRPDPAASLSSTKGELWTSRSFLGLDRGDGDHLLAFLNKKSVDDKPLTFSFSNKPGIGPQYLLLKSEDTTFMGRVASRFAQTYPGLSEEEHVSEVLFGCQFEHRLSRRNKVLSAVEYARNPADLSGSHQIRTQAAWEFLLDPEENLSLRSAVLESSNYTPNREQAKNLNYSLNLLWKY
jgi:hypothetical protein